MFIYSYHVCKLQPFSDCILSVQGWRNEADLCLCSFLNRLGVFWFDAWTLYDQPVESAVSWLALFSAFYSAVIWAAPCHFLTNHCCVVMWPEQFLSTNINRRQRFGCPPRCFRTLSHVFRPHFLSFAPWRRTQTVTSPVGNGAGSEECRSALFSHRTAVRSTVFYNTAMAARRVGSHKCQEDGGEPTELLTVWKHGGSWVSPQLTLLFYLSGEHYLVFSRADFKAHLSFTNDFEGVLEQASKELTH